MFNFISTFKKKFLSYKKTYKLNVFYIKNKKTSFISSLQNYSRTNKPKTWTNLNIKLFNWKINYKSLIYYLINTTIIALFVYFKYEAICYYFTEVLPFEIKLSLPMYLDLLSFMWEFFLNTWWILIFFINTNFINFLIFVDSNIINLNHINSNYYKFKYKTDSVSSKSNFIKKRKKNKWHDLSKKSYNSNINKHNNKSIYKSNSINNEFSYDIITTFNLPNKNYYLLFIPKFFKYSKYFEDFFNKKFSLFSNSYNNIFTSNSNLIKNSLSNNVDLNSLLWAFNRENILTNNNFKIINPLNKNKKLRDLVNKKTFKKRLNFFHLNTENKIINMSYKNNRMSNFFNKF